VDELADSRGLASDPAALRARLAADGYVFLRGLLPAERVLAAGEQVAATLRAGGWTAAGSPLPGRAAGPREALADPAYRAAVMNLAFNALPYMAPLRPGGHRDRPRQPRPLTGTVGDDPRAREPAIRAIQSASGPRALVGISPRGPDAPTAQRADRPSPRPVPVLHRRPLLATLAPPV